jgi:carbonic anhydrase
MVNLMSRREIFINGLIERAGWQPDWAQAHFMLYAPMYEIGHEVDFVVQKPTGSAHDTRKSRSRR